MRFKITVLDFRYCDSCGYGGCGRIRTHYVSRNSSIQITGNECVDVYIIGEVHQGDNHKLFAVKEDKRDVFAISRL